MKTNPNDGQFYLAMWENPDSNDVADHEEFSDNRINLEQEVPRLLKAGKYKYIELGRWNAETDDWVEITSYTEEDIED